MTQKRPPLTVENAGDPDARRAARLQTRARALRHAIREDENRASND